MTRRRTVVLAAVVLFALAQCVWWGLVVTAAWAFREFIICWTPCPDRPDIIARNTREAVELSIWLAINLVAYVSFAVNRRRPGLVVLAAVELVGLAVTLYVGMTFARSDQVMIAFQWWSGSAIAAVTLALIYLLGRTDRAAG